MMEVITSLTLKYALKIPGTAPQMAPQTIAARRHTYHGICRISAKYNAPNTPKVYWPAAPILNSPVLKANATERPVMISGVACAISLPIPFGLR